MKIKTVTVLIVFFALVTCSYALTGNQIETVTLFNQAVSAGTSVYTESRNLSNTNGQFSIQVEATGSGTAKIEFLVSNDGENFVCPSGYDNVLFSGLLSTDGQPIKFIELPVAQYVKFKVTETGSSASVTVKITLSLL